MQTKSYKYLCDEKKEYILSKQLLDHGDTVVGIDNINDYYDVNLKAI